MSAEYQILVSGLEKLQQAVAALNNTNEAQLKVMSSAKDMTAGLKAAAVEGFQRLEKEVKNLTALQKQQETETVKQISSFKQLSANVASTATSMDKINAAMVAGAKHARNQYEATKLLSLETDKYSIKLREAAINTEALNKANATAIANESRIASLRAEAIAAENGMTAAQQKRIATEERLTQIARIRAGVDKEANAARAAYAAQAMAENGAAARLIGYKPTGLTASSFMTGDELKRYQQEMKAAEIYSKNLNTAQREAQLIQAGLASKYDASAQSVKRLGLAHNDLHYAMRGMSAAAGGLWATYGAFIPTLAGFAAAATGIKSAVDAANFEYITQYTDAMGDSADRAQLSLKGMREELMDMQGLMAGPVKLAGGMNELVKAGVKRQDALRELPELARFAAVGEMDLATATEIAVGQSNAFGISISETANKIAKAAAVSAADLHDMGVAMTQTTELGSVAKVTFDEVATGIALISNMGIKGEKAGTSFRTSIIRMLSPTEKLKDMMQNLNIQFSAFNENGEQKSVKQMFVDLEQSISKLSGSDKVAFLQELFSLRGMKGGANVLKEINGMWDEMYQGINNAANGVTFLESTMDQLDGTSKGMWKNLVADFERFTTAIGSSPVIDGLLKSVMTAGSGIMKIFGDMISQTNFLNIALQGPTIPMRAISEGIGGILERMGDSTGDGFFESKFRWLLENAKGILDTITQTIDKIGDLNSAQAQAEGRQKEAKAVIEKNIADNKKAQAASGKPAVVADDLSFMYTPGYKAIQAEQQRLVELGKKLEVPSFWESRMSGQENANLRGEQIMNTPEWQEMDRKAQEKKRKAEEKAEREALARENKITRTVEQEAEERWRVEKDIRDTKTKYMANGVEKDIQMARNARDEDLRNLEKYRKSFTASEFADAKLNIQKNYVDGVDAAYRKAEEVKNKAAEEDAKRLRREADANKEMYEYLADAGRMTSDQILAYKKSALDEELKEIRTKTKNEELIQKYSAEKTREYYKSAYEQGIKFSDGFKFSLMDAQDQLADFGSLGKEVFAQLKDGISSMYKALIKGENVGDVLKSMGENLMDTLLTRFTDTMAVKTLDVGQSLFGGLMDSIGLGSLGGLFGGTGKVGDAAKVYVTNMGGLDSLLGTDTSGGILGSLGGKVAGLLGGVTSGGPMASMANMALAATAAVKAVTSGIGTAGSWFAGMQSAGMGVNAGTQLALIEGSFAKAITPAVAKGVSAGMAGSTGTTSAAVSGGWSAASSGVMGTLATFGAAVGVLGAAIMGIKALMPGSPTTMDRLKSSGATGATFDSSGLTAELQEVTKAMHAAIPALGRAGQAAWDMNTRMLTTVEGMQGFGNKVEESSQALVKHHYQFDAATGSWRSSASVLSKQVVEHMRLGSAAATAANGVESETRASQRLGSAASGTGNSLNSAAAPMGLIRSMAGTMVAPLSSLGGTMRTLGSASSQAASAMASSAGVIRSAASSIQSALSQARSIGGGTSYKKNGGRIGYASGGVLQGGSYEKDDLYLGTVNGVAQIAMGGEYIMPQKQTRKYLPILEGMRRQEYASGGQLPKSALDALAAYAAAGSEGPASIVADIMGKLAEFEMTDYQKSLYNVYKEYEGTRKQLIEAGGNNTQHQLLDKLRDMQVEQAELAPIKEASEALSDFKKELMDVKDATYSTVEAQASLSDLLAKAKTGDFSGVDKISDLLGQIKLEKSNYATSLDYARAYWSTMSMVSELEKLTGVKAKVPGFAAGGSHYGGLRVVGENGPELEYTGPSRIFNARQLIDLTALIAEIRALRGDITAGNVAVATNTKKTADALRRFEIDGMPVKDAV